MLISANFDMMRLVPIVAPSVLLATFLTALIFMFVRMVKQRLRLHNSIILVELKSPVAIYWVLFIAFLIPSFICLGYTISPPRHALELFERAFGNEAATQFCLGAMSGAFLCGAQIYLILAMSKSAVLDKGIYGKNYFYDWYKVYDYLVDENKNTVVLSSDKRGALSLKGVSPPLKFNREDAERIKFILNKNKNKFLSQYEVR